MSHKSMYHFQDQDPVKFENPNLNQRMLSEMLSQPMMLHASEQSITRAKRIGQIT